MSGIRAVIFDLDGLMIDTEPLARRAWDRVLIDHGLRLEDAVFARMIGLRLQESSAVIKKAYGIETPAAELAEMERQYMFQIMKQGIPIMPGLDRLLSELDQHRIPWAVATSSDRSYAEETLSQLNLLDRCLALAAGDEVEEGKPKPDVYLLAAQRLGVNPARCMALEDSAPGVSAAAAAGMRTLAVPNGDTSLMDFQPAHGVYGSLEEVALDLDQLLRLETLN
jgi:HAD superfamily hydrolase (TIGR01509 family)